MLAQPRRLLLRGRRDLTGLHCLPRLRAGRAAHAGHGRQEPARPALAGRSRPAGGRLDHPQRDRVAQAQRHARVGPRPAELPVRTDLPAGQVPAYWFDLDPIRIPHAAAQHRHAHAAIRHAGNRAAPGRRQAQRQPPGRTARPGGSHARRSTARTRGRSPAPGGTASAGTAGRIRTAATPATSGPSPPAPTAARTSPPSPSSCLPGASRPAASQTAPCSTRSRAPARPAWPPSPSAGASPASNSTPRSRPWPPNASGMPPRGNQTAATAGGNDRHAARGRPRHAAGRDRHDRERSGKKTPYPEATNPLLTPSQNAPGGDTLAGPAQGRAATRTHRHGDSRRPVRVVLPDEPPPLTPAAARALLRVLLKAHAAQTDQQAATSGQEGK